MFGNVTLESLEMGFGNGFGNGIWKWDLEMGFGNGTLEMGFGNGTLEMGLWKWDFSPIK